MRVSSSGLGRFLYVLIRRGFFNLIRFSARGHYQVAQRWKWDFEEHATLEKYLQCILDCKRAHACLHQGEVQVIEAVSDIHQHTASGNIKILLCINYVLPIMVYM